MANLRDIKRRIKSVQSTQKITRAMKMVAASKLRRAQESIIQARPYAYHMRDLVNEIANRAQGAMHPLLEQRPENKIGLVLITSDRGLCGGFNASLVNDAIRLLDGRFKDNDVMLVVVGRKGIDILKRRGYPIHATFPGQLDRSVYRTSQWIIENVVKEFLEENLSSMYCMYNEFRSAVQQTTTLERLLPFISENEDDINGGNTLPLDYIYEPDQESVFEALLLKNLEIQMHRILFESAASEFGARMTAMDSATRNAGEMIERLTLQYNRVRQDAITTQLIEVVSGAEAL